MIARSCFQNITTTLCLFSLLGTVHACAQNTTYKQSANEARQESPFPSYKSDYALPVGNTGATMSPAATNESALGKLKTLHRKLSQKVSTWGRSKNKTRTTGVKQNRLASSPQWRDEYGPIISSNASATQPGMMQPPQRRADQGLRQPNSGIGQNSLRTAANDSTRSPNNIRQARYEQEILNQAYSNHPPLDGYAPVPYRDYNSPRFRSSATYQDGQQQIPYIEPPNSNPQEGILPSPRQQQAAPSQLESGQKVPLEYELIENELPQRRFQATPGVRPQRQPQYPATRNQRSQAESQFGSGPIAATYSDGHMSRGVVVNNRYLATQITASQRVLQLEQEKSDIINRYNSVVTLNRTLKEQLNENRQLLEQIQSAISGATNELQSARSTNGKLQSRITILIAAQMKQKQQTDEMLKAIQDNLDEVLAKELSDNK